MSATHLRREAIGVALVVLFVMGRLLLAEAAFGVAIVGVAPRAARGVSGVKGGELWGRWGELVLKFHDCEPFCRSGVYA